MSSMTGNEFSTLRSEDITPNELSQRKKTEEMQGAIDAMKTKDFLIGRTKETIKVPISGLGGTKYIEVRARLSKAEMKQHKGILDRWTAAQNTDVQFIESEEDEHQLAVFLAHITIDDSLSAAFWLSDELDPRVADMILTAYFIDEPIARVIEIQKFLGERVRAGIRPDVAGMGSDTEPVR